MTRKTSLRRSLVLALTVAVALPLALTASIAIAPTPSLTDAAWTDAEFASGTLTAATLSSPIIDSCSASGVLGIGATATLRWHFPTGFGYTVPTNAQFYLATNGLLTGLGLVNAGASTPTTPDANGVYTTTFSTALLGSLLGADALIGVATKLENWTSPVVTRFVHWGFLNNYCA
jgi:hypothetical protein